MPSVYANMIARAITDAIGRPLTADESLRCEELGLNIFANGAIHFINTLARSMKRQGKRPKFEHFYEPLMDGIVAWATKTLPRDRFRFDTKDKRDIYALMHAFIGNGFSQGQLGNIIWMIEHCTAKEVSLAMRSAEYRGTIHSGYVRAIIAQNRRRAVVKLASSDPRFAHLTDERKEYVSNVGLPNVKEIQDRWIFRIKRVVASGKDPKEMEPHWARKSKKKIQEHSRRSRKD